MNSKFSIKKFLYTFIYISFLFLLSVPTNAAERKHVRVAFFPMNGYHVIDSNGNYGGMDVEYLTAISEYTNWDIEYVPCDTWNDALEMLSDKKVDLVGSAQYSAERAKKFDYADLSSGYTFGVIATNLGKDIAYEDFDAMGHIIYGVVENYVRKNEFLDYLSANGIESPRIKTYSSTSDLEQALGIGAIDAFVHSLTEVSENRQVIGRFAPRPFYYITYKGNSNLLEELNQAIADLKFNQPELESELMSKYFHDRMDKSNLLTTDEKEYIEANPMLTIGYIDGFYPFSYEKDGLFYGLARDMLQAGLESTGLHLEYKKYENEEQAKTALSNGEISLLSYYTCTDPRTTASTLYKYAEIPLVLVRNKKNSHKNTEVLVTTQKLEKQAADTIDTYNASLITCNSQQDCLTLLHEGFADTALCGGYLAEHLLRTTGHYSNFEIQTVLAETQPVYIALSITADPTLKSIISKTTTTISAKNINEHMLRENEYPLITFQQFIYQYSIPLLAGLVLILLAIIIVIYHMVRDNRKIQKLLYKDTSFDIWNLNYLIYWGEQKLLPEHKGNYALISLNISQFRQFNIIYGWNSGESLLETVTKNLKDCVNSKSEICARSQSDRFVLLLQWDEDWNLFLRRLNSIQRKLEEKIFLSTDNRMLIQMGVYPIPSHHSDLRLAVDYANQALEVITNSGETLKVYDAPFEAMLKERHEREKVLEAADIQKDFVAYYQSKVDIRTEEIVGAEALVRFKDPTANGQIRAPGYFIAYYEATGRITELDFFVLESTCKMLRKRMDEGKPVIPISCNFSRIHFVKPDFSDHFESILEKYAISKDLIEVEITETLVMDELQQQSIKQTIDTLRDRGIRLSIDDFGSGYSSLGVFEQIPASVVKLDRSFLLNQENKDRQVKIMRGIVQMAEDLDAQVVCEGVENANDVNLMKEIHAYVAQGYYYSKPICEAEFEEKLDASL